ncbi:MAG: T9SS type A sorting domain-containing protein [Candidatus Zixiibacteriota bacterium]|nr:MAG: T9SS type A sorting domain-containing protein [candidate division Zixibacteria bacterium]
MNCQIQLSIVAVLSVCVPAAATIINIPDDYTTIQAGINASYDYDTVLVQPGIYFENLDIQNINITLASLFAITGDEYYIWSTIVDGDYAGSVITIECDSQEKVAVIGFTVQNGSAMSGSGMYCSGSILMIAYNDIRYNYYYSDPLFCDGGGISCLNSSGVIKNNKIRLNIIFAGGWAIGGGIYCNNYSGAIANNIICVNEVKSAFIAAGGGIYCRNSSPLIINNVIYENRARLLFNPFSDTTYGGAIYCEGGSLPTMVNCILFDNYARLGPEIWPSTFSSITYSLVTGGWSGEGNIGGDPSFREPYDHNFHLMAIECGNYLDSPCIDAGDPDIVETLLDCSWGLGTGRSDMGAYGGIDSAIVNIEDENLLTPSSYMSISSFPNPFNGKAIISYNLPTKAEFTISIYNLLGQRVATILKNAGEAGEHSICWEATDYPSGVYFARLEAGGSSKTAKMVLLK